MSSSGPTALSSCFPTAPPKAFACHAENVTLAPSAGECGHGQHQPATVELTELIGPRRSARPPQIGQACPQLGSSTSTTMAATPTATAAIMSTRSVPEMNACRAWATAVSNSPSLLGARWAPLGLRPMNPRSPSRPKLLPLRKPNLFPPGEMSCPVGLSWLREPKRHRRTEQLEGLALGGSGSSQKFELTRCPGGDRHGVAGEGGEVVEERSE